LKCHFLSVVIDLHKPTYLCYPIASASLLDSAFQQDSIVQMNKNHNKTCGAENTSAFFFPILRLNRETMACFAAIILFFFPLPKKEAKKARFFPEICGQKIRTLFCRQRIEIQLCCAPLYFGRTSPLAPDAKVGTGAKLQPDLSAIRSIFRKNRVSCSDTECRDLRPKAGTKEIFITNSATVNKTLGSLAIFLFPRHFRNCSMNTQQHNKC
jgi:hypothetical protein